MITIHTVTWESDSAGRVDWYWLESSARAGFAEWVGMASALNDDINRFSFEMPDDATPDEITREADTRMWALDYVAIESRPATNDGIKLTKPEENS